MQVLSKEPETKLGHGLSGEDRGGKHSSAHTLLSMYASPPREEISMDEFERLALERLRVLKGIEDLKLRGKSETDILEKTKELIGRHLTGATNSETARMDQLSHYILRLAYCSKPELRKWFLSMESELFRMRFLDVMRAASDRTAFLQREKLEYSPVPDNELRAVEGKLRQVQVATGEKEERPEPGQVYKVPFTSVPDLVSQRKVYLQGGFAYVWQKDLASLVVQDFRASLSKGLSSINRRWREIFPDTDQRLRPLVEGLSQRYLGPDLGSTTQQRRSDLTVANLAAVSARHFPLCMHNLMQAVRRDHHLKHAGRQQLSLFLKAVGLPLEEALVFWRTEFAPRVPADKFEKEYAYNIRHNYGKEGKMTDYTAHNCVSLVRMSGGADEFHGCPYRRMDEASLRANLAALRCDSARVDEAMQKKAGNHFQLACACAFEGIHHAQADLGINHPTQYYQESRRVYDEREAKAAAAAGGAPAMPGQQGGAAAVDGTPGAGGMQRRNPFAPMGGIAVTPMTTGPTPTRTAPAASPANNTTATPPP